MRILDQPALDETEYLACVAAFATALGNELAATENYLVKLAGKRKGAHFGWELAFDRARYGALIVLERWKELNQRFAESLANTPRRELAATAPAKCDTAAEALQAAYQSLDELDEYSELIVQEAARRLRAVLELFAPERQAAVAASEAFSAERPALNVLGTPAVASPAEIFRRTRDTFLADLSRR